MKIVIIGVAVAAAAFGLALMVGLLLPETRTGSAQRLMRATPDTILSVITDVAAQPNWRSDVRAIEAEGDAWVEVTRSGDRIRFEWTERTATTLALRFRSDRGVVGTWRARLVPETGGTRLAVEERASIRGPLGRLIAALLFDPNTFSERYLDELAQRLEKVS